MVYKQATALFFLSLFVCIHVVKLAHHHDSLQAVPIENTQEASISSPSFNCDVCDYQIAKDTHNFIEFPALLKTEGKISDYSFYNTPFVTSIGSTSSGRGPPALS